ncbi:MAG: ABC transporter ATP-binding protein [Actinomycetota bacterium]
MTEPRATGPPVLDADFGCRHGDFAVDVQFAVTPGSVTALVGPNGSGKSTVLRALAGLLPLDRGHVRVDGAALSDAATDVHVPTEGRPIGLVFQQHLLFPKMSARDNVAFGLRAHGLDRAAARARAQQLLNEIELGTRADATPGELSGGQAQRVALARALAVAPRLLLLDEPFAALDPPARAVLRADLRRHAEAFTGGTIVVTHDPLDALVLADYVVAMESGHIVQSGVPAELARRPRTDYIARLAGLNLLRGTARGTTVLVGSTPVAIAESRDGEVLIAIRPNSIAVHLMAPEGSPRNAWPAVLTSVEVHGDQVRLATSGPLDLLADVTPEAAAQLRLAPGTAVWLAVKATEVTAYPA